jgi:hypothetical protein
MTIPAKGSDTIPEDDKVYDKAGSDLDTTNGEAYFNLYDTIPIVDTIKTKTNANKLGLNSIIDYNAKNKGMIDFVKRKAYLFGDAVTKFEDTELTAEYIEIDFSSNTVIAYGLHDSLGNIIGKPVFKEGNETFKADTIRYNFDTKQGIVNDVITEYDGSFLHGGKVKIHENRHNHILGGKFTTCDLEHPHFYFSISKAIVIPNDKIVSGPVFLVLSDVPTPLGLPFGFFPISNKARSGVVIPGIGQDNARGFNLNNGGYYWAINEHLDLKLLGTIFSKGSWAMNLKSNYAVRYKFNGYVDFTYNKNINSYKGLNAYSVIDLFSFKWVFTQDPKAIPGMRFSADVNMSSATYDKYNSYTSNNYMQNTKQSSISFSKSFSGSKNLSVSLRHTQNTTNGSIEFILPDASFSTGKIFPLQRKVKTGATKWYEKVSISYTGNLKNTIATNEKNFFELKPDNIKNGIKHSIPVSTSFSFLKYTTLTPTFNYTERWYTKEIEKTWSDTSSVANEIKGYLETNYENKFSRIWDYGASLDWKTQIYGTFNFKQGKLKAIRHAFQPTITLSFNPGFNQYYKEYYTSVKNNVSGEITTIGNYYSKFEGAPYGGPSRLGSGLVTLNLGNNLEMKVRDKNDTVTGDKKIKIFESFNIRTSYNMFIDSMKLTPLLMSARTKVGLLNFDFSATLSPYALQKNIEGYYVEVNKFAFTVDTLKGKIARLTHANISTNFSLNSNKDEQKSSNRPINHNDEMLRHIYGYPYQYVNFDAPWDVNISYNLTYSEVRATNSKSITQSLGLQGNISLTKKWKVGFSTGFDFKAKEATYTTIDIYRDLHCWEASFHCVPFGNNRSYRFQINVKAPMLQDIKYLKSKDFKF